MTFWRKAGPLDLEQGDTEYVICHPQSATVMDGRESIYYAILKSDHHGPENVEAPQNADGPAGARTRAIDEAWAGYFRARVLKEWAGRVKAEEAESEHDEVAALLAASVSAAKSRRAAGLVWGGMPVPRASTHGASPRWAKSALARCASPRWADVTVRPDGCPRLGRCNCTLGRCPYKGAP